MFVFVVAIAHVPQEVLAARRQRLAATEDRLVRALYPSRSDAKVG
jgi:hypothetical protein